MLKHTPHSLMKMKKLRRLLTMIIALAITSVILTQIFTDSVFRELKTVNMQHSVISTTPNISTTDLPPLNTDSYANSLADLWSQWSCDALSVFVAEEKKQTKYLDCDIAMKYIRRCLNSTEIGRKPLPNFYLNKNINNLGAYKEYRDANIAFVHLPKAGGTSVESVLYNVPGINKNGVLHKSRVSHCSDMYRQASSKGFRRNSAQTLFYSKRTFGLHNYAYRKRPFVYVTWMREPINRMMSTYFYTKKTNCFSVHYICRKYVTETSNLTEYLMKTSNIHFQDMDNFYVRLLQFGDFPEIDSTFEDCCGGVELKDVYKIPAIQKKHYLVAKRNLEQNFGFIGLMEDFKTSKEMLTRLFGISHNDDIHINSNPHSYNLTDYEFNELSRRNIWDIKLYKIAKKIYQQQKDNFLKLTLNSTEMR